jgi:histidine phosphotransferase ChpT
MGEHNLRFAALVGSRICHDLISPIGAINNGMELLAMTGGAPSPEMALIAESVEAANARIKFFRIAYSAPSETQQMGRSEIMSILRDLTRGSRLTIRYEPTEHMTRSEIQIAFLAIQCAEQALPYGGDIALTRADDRWEITLKAERMALDAEHWTTMTGPNPTDDPNGDVKPGQVQFLLLPLHAADQGRKIELIRTDGLATLRV